MTTQQCGEGTHFISGNGPGPKKRKEPWRTTAPSFVKAAKQAEWLYLRRTAASIVVLMLDRVLAGAGLVAASAAVGSTV
jgi:hypothetical protein